jgi:hypothetical protein
MAGAMVAPSITRRPTPSQFTQSAFPMPPAAPAVSSPTTPSAPSGGGGRDVQTGTGTTISGGTQGGFNIGPANVATAEQAQQSAAIQNASIMDPSTYGDLLAGQIGLATSVNPNTGLVSASAPGFMGLMGAGGLGVMASGMGAMMQDKQEQATINSINISNTENGIVSVNGMNIAVVNGKLYGNLFNPKTGQHMPYHQVRKAVLQYLQQNPYQAPMQSNIMQNIMQSEEAQMAVEDVLAYAYAEPGRGDGTVYGNQGGDFGTGSHPGEDDGVGVSGSMGGGFGTGAHGGEKAYGGMIGFAAGGLPEAEQAVAQQKSGLSTPAGFIDGEPENFSPQKTVADDKAISVPEGSFIINAPAVEVAGSQDIKKMLMEAYTVLGKKVDKAPTNTKILSEEEVDILISSGEVVVPPELAGIIGYDRLRKINNRGKDEVARRQAESEQQGGRRSGGFISGYANGDIVGDVGEEVPYETSIPLPKSTRKKFEAYLKKPKSRQSVEQFIDSLTDKEKLVVLGLAETTASKDPIESMMGVGQVAINRAKSNRPDFVNVNDLGAVMKQRSSRGSGSKMFQYDGLEPKFLYPRIQEIVEGRSPTAVSKTFMAAENLLDPETEFDPILPSDVMFYTDPNAPLAKDFENNPMMQYFTSMSGHDYYSLMAAPEFP